MKIPWALRYADVPVGVIQGVFESDNTHYGTIELTLGEQTALQARIREFIAFSIEWHGRLERNQESPPAPEEFDRFNDLISAGQWRVRRSDGTEHKVWQAPVFLADGEITWSPNAESERRRGDSE